MNIHDIITIPNIEPREVIVLQYNNTVFIKESSIFNLINKYHVTDVQGVIDRVLEFNKITNSTDKRCKIIKDINALYYPLTESTTLLESETPLAMIELFESVVNVVREAEYIRVQASPEASKLNQSLSLAFEKVCKVITKSDYNEEKEIRRRIKQLDSAIDSLEKEKQRVLDAQNNLSDKDIKRDKSLVRISVFANTFIHLVKSLIINIPLSIFGFGSSILEILADHGKDLFFGNIEAATYIRSIDGTIKQLKNTRMFLNKKLVNIKNLKEKNNSKAKHEASVYYNSISDIYERKM